MDKQQEKSINRTIALGLQEISMLLVEAHIAIEKNDNKISDEQYSVFREIADKQWDKFNKKILRIQR